MVLLGVVFGGRGGGGLGSRRHLHGRGRRGCRRGGGGRRGRLGGERGAGPQGQADGEEQGGSLHMRDPWAGYVGKVREDGVSNHRRQIAPRRLTGAWRTHERSVMCARHATATRSSSPRHQTPGTWKSIAGTMDGGRISLPRIPPAVAATPRPFFYCRKAGPGRPPRTDGAGNQPSANRRSASPCSRYTVHSSCGSAPAAR